MAILVSDTSVLIDLERGSLLPAAFGCGLQLIVPDLLYQDELDEYNGQYLRTLGLGVVALSSTEVAAAQAVCTGRPTLSLSDGFAMVLAGRAEHSLLTGDANLKRECASRGVPVFGLLWLLDQMANNGVAVGVLRDGLQILSDDVRCRLPRDEVAERLALWAPS